MTQKVFGTAIGLALGFALAFGGFGHMLVVAVFAAIGFTVAKILTGEIDLAPYLSGRRGEQ